MKIALISHIHPPSPSGQSVMLYRILSLIDPSSYFLIASKPQQSDNGSLRLKSQFYTLPPEPVIRSGIRRIDNILNLILSIVLRTRHLLDILRREPARAIVACTGDLADIPTAFLASRFARIPFYAYIFDDYVYQWTGNYRRFAQIVAPYIFKRATGIIAPNEFLIAEYRQGYGVEPALVRNPCDINELGKAPFPHWPAESGKIKIIYTGAIYHANFDCFRNLIAAMETVVDYPLELHIFTAQTQKQLQAQGIGGKKVIIYSHVPYGKILEQQREADILFLPLAFDSPISEVIRTSSPGKLGEYLASGRPILAHVPADSFVADYCGRHHCAAIASENDVTALAQEIRKIVDDAGYRYSLTQNAVSQAKIDFSPEQAKNAFLRAVS